MADAIIMAFAFALTLVIAALSILPLVILGVYLLDAVTWKRWKRWFGYETPEPNPPYMGRYYESDGAGNYIYSRQLTIDLAPDEYREAK